MMNFTYLSDAQKAKMKQVAKDASEKAARFNEAQTRLYGAMSGLGWDKSAKELETESNDIWGKESKDKTVLRGFYRQYPDRKRLCMAYAMMHGLTWDEFYSGSPEAISKMEKLGKDFNKTFMREFPITEEKRKLQDQIATKEAVNIYHYYSNKRNLGLPDNFQGVLDNDRGIVDNYEKCQLMQLPFEISSFISESSDKWSHDLFMEGLDKKEAAQFKNKYTMDNSGVFLQQELNRRFDFLASDRYKKLAENPDLYFRSPDIEGDISLRLNNLAIISNCINSPDFQKESFVPYPERGSILLQALPQSEIRSYLKDNKMENPKTLAENPAEAANWQLLTKEISSFSGKPPILVENLGTVEEPNLRARVNPEAQKEANHTTALKQGITMSFADEGIDPLKYKWAAEKGKFSNEQLSYGAKKFDENFGTVFNKKECEALKTAGFNEMDCIFVNGKSANELYGKKYDHDPNKMKAALIADCFYGRKNLSYTAVGLDKNKALQFLPPKPVYRKLAAKNPMPEPQEYGKGHRFLRWFGKQPETIAQKFEKANDNAEKAAESARYKVALMQKKTNVRTNHPFAQYEASLSSKQEPVHRKREHAPERQAEDKKVHEHHSHEHQAHDMNRQAGL